MSIQTLRNIFFTLLLIPFFSGLSGQTQLIMSKEGGCFDETVRMKLTAKDFTNVTRMTASFTWSIAIVDFEAPCINNLPGLNIGSFDFSGLSDGLLTIDWNDPTGQGITWPEDQPLLELCFKIKGPVGSMTPANLVDNPVETAIYTVDSGTDPISISKSQGSITVTECGPQTVKFFASNETTTHIAQDACVKVTAEDFNNIQGFQFALAWDASELNYTSVENLNLQGLTNLNFDVSNTQSGILPVNWTSPATDGVTMADGETLFEVCFNSDAAPVTTTVVTFVGVPDQISAADQFRRDMIVEVNNGSVVTEFQPLNLIVSDTIIDRGEQFCLKVEPEFFFGISEFEFGLEWDQTVIQYESSNAYFLPGFSEDRNFDTDNVLDGMLNIFWQDPTNLGVFAPNNETLFEICFTAIGNPGALTNIEISSSSRAVSNLAGLQNVGVDLSGGEVMINDFFAETVEIVNTTCLTKDLGAIDVNIIGGTAPVRILWSNSETTEDISGLQEGNYTLILTDNSIPPRVYTKTFEVQLDDPDAPDAIVTPGSVVDCLNSPLQLDGTSSSQGNFNYLWETTDGDVLSGGMTLEPTVQGAGVYVLNVTDAASGCCSRTEFTLENAIPPTADAGAPFDLNCYNPERNIDATNSTVGNNIRFVWITSDGNIIRNADTPFPAINRPGTYNLTVIDTTTSCQDISSVTVGQDFDPPIAEAGNVKVITCDTLEQVLNGVGSDVGANFSYQWTTVDGFFVGDETTLNPRVNAPGLYIITVLNERNGCEDRDSIRVFGGSDLPFVDPGPDTVLTCNINEIILDQARAPQGPTFEHYWYTNDGNIVSNWNTLTPTIDQPGTYALEVYDRQTNCRNIASLEVVADFDAPLLVPENFQIEYPCDGGVVDLLVEDRSGFPVEYTWSTNDGNFIGGINQNNTAVGGPGTYTLTAQNRLNGCFTEINIFVSEPQVPEATINATTILDCNNEEVQLTGAVSNNAGQPTLEWYTTDGNITGQTDEIITMADQAGTYYLVVNTMNGCRDTATFDLEANFTAPLAVLPDSAAITCLEKEVELDGSGSTDGDEIGYFWTTTDGNIIDDDRFTATVDQSGLYFLTLRDEMNGCEAVDSVFVNADTIGPNIILSPLDTIGCNGTLDLDASASDMGNFRWEDSQGGNIVSGENTANPTIDKPGLYTVVLTDPNSGCTSTAQTEVVFAANLPLADAGVNFAVCENGGQLDANLPDGVEGEWKLLTAGSEVEDVTIPNTEITNLLPGVNTFVWQLTKEECINYSTDTVRVTFADTPIAADDFVEPILGQSTVGFNILNNDDVPSDPSQYTIEIQNIPQIGDLVDLGDGQFRYDYNGEDGINVDFQYLLCSTACPDLCSQATVTISFDGKEILSDIPDVITPNGDGLNDELYFEEIGNGTYPNAEILIFNRYGDEVFRSQPYINEWRGQNNSNKDLPHGTYYFVLKLDAGGQNVVKGNVTIMN